MFKLENYSEYRDDSDPAYIGGKAVDAPDGNSIEGTQYDQRFFNQVIGFFQSVIFDAFGNMEVSELPDSIKNPEVLNALKVIMYKITNEMSEQILFDRVRLEREIETNAKQHIDMLNLINDLTARLAAVEDTVYGGGSGSDGGSGDGDGGGGGIIGEIGGGQKRIFIVTHLKNYNPSDRSFYDYGYYPVTGYYVWGYGYYIYL